MSEFKFACPVCGQHITCDAAAGGAPMECPTCFRQLLVPQAATAPGSKLLLTATEADRRPHTTIGAGVNAARPVPRKFPVIMLVSGLVLCGVVAAALAFQGPLRQWLGQAPAVAPQVQESPTLRSAPDPEWTLNLGTRKTPTTPLSGRVLGYAFAPERTTLQGGTLTFRQGRTRSPEAGVTIHLFARRSEDLAGQTVLIEATRTNAPKLTLRSKPGTAPPMTVTLPPGYALRLEFGDVTNGRLSGSIYLSAPDENHSWLAGTFNAEIRRPPPPKPKP